VEQEMIQRELEATEQQLQVRSRIIWIMNRTPGQIKDHIDTEQQHQVRSRII